LAGKARSILRILLAISDRKKEKVIVPAQPNPATQIFSGNGNSRKKRIRPETPYAILF